MCIAGNFPVKGVANSAAKISHLERNVVHFKIPTQTRLDYSVIIVFF